MLIGGAEIITEHRPLRRNVNLSPTPQDREEESADSGVNEEAIGILTRASSTVDVGRMAEQTKGNGSKFPSDMLVYFIIALFENVYGVY